MWLPLLGIARLRKKSNTGGQGEEEAGQASRGKGDRSDGPLCSWGGTSSQNGV